MPQEWEEHSPLPAKPDQSHGHSTALSGCASGLWPVGPGNLLCPYHLALPRDIFALPSAELHMCPIRPHPDGEVQKAGRGRGRISIHGKAGEAARCL